MVSLSTVLFLTISSLLILSVSGQQSYCRIDGYEYPCPRVVESLYVDYRVYGRFEVVAYAGLPRGNPLDIPLAMVTGIERIWAYFDGYNRGNVTIPRTFPHGIIVNYVTHTYFPFLFLPVAYIGRAPAPVNPEVIVGNVERLGTVEPMSVTFNEAPNDTRIRDFVLATHYVLRQHDQSYEPNVFAFLSYDLLSHRGPIYDSEVWVFPAPPADTKPQ